MALNIRPFEFNYQPIKAGPVQPIMGGQWGPPDMAKQLQEGIAGILPALAESYKGVNKQRNMELQGAELMAQKTAGVAPQYQQPGQTGPFTATNPASPQSLPQNSQAKFTPEIEQIFQQQSQQSGIPVEYYRKVAGIESMGDPRAKSPLSSASGLFQITDETWKGYGSGDRLNPVDNTTAMTKLTLDNQQQLRSALGRDPTPGELYLAHQQGAGGAKALLSDPQGNVVDVLSTAYGGDKNKALTAIKNNGGNPNMTSGQFASRWVGDAMGSATGAPPTVVSSSVVQPGDTVAKGASAVSSGGLSDPALAYKTRLQEMFPQVKVTSEFRSLAQNNAVGGAQGSQHLSGNALDINTAGMTEEQKQAVIQDAVNNGAKGIGWYNPNSMHVDFRQTPAAWGPNKSYSTIGRTPPWFQQIAATLKGSGSTGNAQLPVQPQAPSVVAAQQPGVVPASGPTRGSTASGQQQPPLFSTPQLAGATAAAGQQGGQPGQQPIPPQQQPPNPQPQLTGAPPPAPQQAPMQGTPLQPGQPAPAPAPMPGGGVVAGPGGNPPPAPPPSGLTFADVLKVPDLPDTVKQYFSVLAQSQGPATPINPRAILMDPQAPEQAKLLAQNIMENAAKPPPAPAPAPAEPGRVVGTENIADVIQANQPPAPNLRRGTREPPPPVVTNPPPPVVTPAPQQGPVNPRQGPAGLQTDPNVQPPPAPVRPAPAEPATTGAVASRPNSSAVPPEISAIGVRAGLVPAAANNPLSLRMLGRAFSTGDEGVVQATVGAINALTQERIAAAGEGGWTYHKDFQDRPGDPVQFKDRRARSHPGR